jgi:hypothetical protein
MTITITIGLEPLTSHGRISRDNGTGHGQIFTRLDTNMSSHLHHGNVGNFGGGIRNVLFLVLTLFIHRRKAHGHVATRNNNVIETRIAIVHDIVANLGSNITRLDSGQEFVRIHAAQWDQKVVHPTVDTIAIQQMGNHHGMIRGASQRAGPKLGTRQCGRMNDPTTTGHTTFGFGKKGGRCFQSANIGSLVTILCMWYQ